MRNKIEGSMLEKKANSQFIRAGYGDN